MNFWSRLLGKGKSAKYLERSQTQGAKSSNSGYRDDPFIASCLEVNYRELEDERWFSHFKELPEIDNLRKLGKKQEALALCLRSLENFSDSFLFYERAADLFDDMGKSDDAERILKDGLSKSLSKCSLAVALADRAFARGDYRGAILWWIRAGILQLESKIMVDKMPFLNLAYICKPIGFKSESEWFLEMADRASNEGPIRFNAEGAKLRHRVAQRAIAAGDDAALFAIQAFHERYK